VVIPLERRVTPLRTRKATARTGFAYVARVASLLALRMLPDIRRVSHTGYVRGMRLIGDIEVGL
jgi:hypothetical protein